MTVRSRAPEFGPLAKDFDGVFTLADVRAAGPSPAALRWAVNQGLVRRLRHGAYTPSDLWEQATPDRRQRLLLAAHLRFNPGSIGHGVSAAAALGLPVPLAADLVRPQVRRREDGEPVLRLDDSCVITSAAVTVLDTARALGREWGLAVADASLGGWATTRELAAALDDARGLPGYQAAAWAVSHARPGAESPLESLARAVIVLGGYPEPDLQVRVPTPIGQFRVDLMDVARRLVVEADGRVKYTDSRVVWEEKRREDAIRAAGFRVVRFTMDDYRRRGPWLAVYGEAHGRS